MKEDIIIFGTGRYYKFKKEELLKNFSIVAFIDNSVQSGTEKESDLQNIKMYSTNDIESLPDVRIMLCSVRFFDMAAQLRSLGISGDRILFGINYPPDYDNAEVCLHRLGYNLFYRGNDFFLKNEASSFTIKDESEYKDCLRKFYSNFFSEINLIKSLPLVPFNRRFGADHGKPVDRIYIEKFLEKNKSLITGDVVEVADNFYTMKYATDFKSYTTHVNGWGGALKVNFATGDGVIDGFADCIICTQTLQMIFDFENAIRNLSSMLKPGGALILTAHCIAQISMYDYANWGKYWRFTPKCISELFKKYFDDVEVKAFGNVKTATSLLYGLSAEDLVASDFEYDDEQYTVIIGVCAKK